MAINASTQMANRDVVDLIFKRCDTGKPFLHMNYANTSTTNVTSESVFAYGGQGRPKKVTFNGEKSGTISFETQMQTPKLWSLISGADISATGSYLAREVIKATETGLTVSGSIKEGTTVYVYPKDDDMDETKIIECTFSGSAVTATKTSDVTTGSEYVIYYEKSITDAVVMSINSKTFPRDFSVTGSTWYKDTDGNIIAQKLVVYKCSPQSTFELSFSNTGDPATITITCDMMQDDDDNFMDLIFEEDKSED